MCQGRARDPVVHIFVHACPGSIRLCKRCLEVKGHGRPVPCVSMATGVPPPSVEGDRDLQR